MTEPEIILVDTNVLLDITEHDELWADWSQEQMGRYLGRMVVNPMIYSELCHESEDTDDVDAILLTLGVDFREIPRLGLFLAAQAFKLYRQRGGSKTAPLPDFFIGAHAAALGIPIITRDVGRYRTYFPGVELISP